MRLNLVTPLRTRPGDFTKDARMVNCYPEIKNKEATARKRPGTNHLVLSFVNGQGLSDMTDFSDRLFSISGDSYAISEVA